MVCKISLEPERLCFDIDEVHFELVVSRALVRIRKVKSYNRRLTEVRLVLELTDGSVKTETFSIKKALRFLNYPNYTAITGAIEGVILR